MKMTKNQRNKDKLDEKEEFIHIQENHQDIKKFIEEIEHFLKNE